MRQSQVRLNAIGLVAAIMLWIAAPVPHADGATPTDRVRFYFNVTTGGATGNIVEFDLLGNESPLHVANFLDYVDDGEYDTSFVHRTRAFNPAQPLEFDFFAQGGSFRFPSNTNLASNPIVPRDPVPNEFDADNGLSNTPGTLSAARTSDPDSATSGWFINQSDNSASFDPGPFTVFGQVTRGMDLIDAIPFLPNSPALEGSAFESTPFVNGGLVVIERAVRIGLVDGDYNLDGVVGPADYVVWRDTIGNEVGSTLALQADGNADGSVDAADYNLWMAQYGATAGSNGGSTSAIPEPASVVLVLMLALGAMSCSWSARLKP